MGADGDVIVLWLTEGGPDASIWSALLDPDLLFAQAPPTSMARAIPASLAQGPVVAVVKDDRHAHQALALGVDEVLRAEDVSKETLSAAAQKARLRAVGRDARPRPLSGDDRAQELLGASVSFRLMTPLAAASLNLEVLRTAMDAVVGLADAYTESASGNRAPLESEAARIVALRASAPPTQELKATMTGLAAALHEATLAVAQIYTLVAPDSLDDTCDLAVVVPEVAHVVRVIVERVAEFHVEVPADAPCQVQMPRSVVVQTLSALLTNAVHAVGDRKERGVVTVRVVRRVAAALIEVIDDGVGMSPAVLERAMDSFFTTRGGRAAGLGLSLATERVRRRGGELVLESELGRGTTARIFAPIAMKESAPPPQGNLN